MRKTFAASMALILATTVFSAFSSFIAFAAGPGVSRLSGGDEYSSYQWALKNDGSLHQTSRRLNIRSLDRIYVHHGEDGIDAIALPPLAPSNYDFVSTAAVAGIDINIQPAWEQYSQLSDKRQITVAVIDTGIDFSHPDLAASAWVNSDEIPGDGIDNDGNGYIDDINGWNFISNSNQLCVGSEDSHGTHAAGTIAAAKNNGGIVGIADPDYVKLMSLKVLGGEEGKGSPESVIAAIHYAEANGAQICNLSFGSSSISEDVMAAIQNSSMLFVAAAGNGGQLGIGYDIDANPVYPASLPYDNIITVANLLFDGNLDKSSNYGASGVDIAAPGSYILSTIPDSSYGYMSGTSMAAPMVTGAAALLLSAHPDWSIADAKSALLSTAHKLAPLKGRMLSSGMLDVAAAMNYQKQ